MNCSISGEVANEPVVSPRSGAVFDRKNIVNYITTTGTDPLTDEPLTIEDLVPIKTPISHIVPPKPPQFASIPLLLSTFQNEWDALALEVFTLRKQLHKARQELSSALYHQDAAVRVAANAIRERDEAKQALQQLAISIGQEDIDGELKSATTTTTTTTPNGNAIPVDKINTARDELYQQHKSHKPTVSVTPEQSTTIAFVSDLIHPFKLVENSFLIPKTKHLLLASKTKLIEYDYNTKGSSTIPRKKTPILALNYVYVGEESKPIIAYKDKVFIEDTQFTTTLTNVFQIIVHPKLTTLFIMLSADKWSINDTELGELHVAPMDNIVCGDIHVDGAIVAIATKDHIKVFSVTNGEEISQFDMTYSTPVKLKFGLNGFWLFAANKNDEAGCIDVIDLRKNTTVHTVQLTSNLRDFVVDPSTSFVISYDGTLKLHRYVKKGKKWMDSVSELQPQQTLASIGLLTDEIDDDFVSKDHVKVLAVGETSATYEYEIAYN
jgi:pre-mRNA-processing factor 19